MKVHKPDIGGNGSKQSGSLAVDAMRSKRRGNHPSRCRVVSKFGGAVVQNEIFDDGASEALPQLMSDASDDEVPFSNKRMKDTIRNHVSKVSRSVSTFKTFMFKTSLSL